jgi:Zn-dependent M28 family amino/carboxypeptidase
VTDWIGDTFTSDAGWAHLERLVDIGNRMAGSPGERAALEATRDALADVGAREPRIEKFDVQGWRRGSSDLRLSDGASVRGADRDCIALPRSPDAAAEGELVDLGHGVPEDFEAADVEGAVVVVGSDSPDAYDRFVHRREKYYAAVEAGAAAFVFRNHVEGALPPTGSVGRADEPIGPIPAVGVSRELGGRLARRYAADGDAADGSGESVEVAVDCGTGEAESGNVHAELGPDTDERVIVSAHADAHDIAEGAMDNGAGTATVVEVARALAAREDDLDTRVEFVVYGAEEVGLVGSTREADRSDLDAVRAVVNVDSNVAGRTLSVAHHSFDGLADAAEAVEERFDHPVRTDGELVPHSDHWPFVQHGVPGYMISAETEGRGRGWGHTHADTLDKLEARTLREQAVLLTELVVEVADAGRGVERRDPSAVAEQLEAEDKAAGMRAVGEWPY